MGRPSTAPNRRQVGLSDDEWKRVTTYRFTHFIDSESATLRELVLKGLAAAEASPAPAKVPVSARGSRGRQAR
jgi:hypothetical protein